MHLAGSGLFLFIYFVQIIDMYMDVYAWTVTEAMQKTDPAEGRPSERGRSDGSVRECSIRRSQHQTEVLKAGNKFFDTNYQAVVYFEPMVRGRARDDDSP